MKLDVHIGLKRQEISHSKDSRVHRGGVLDLERSDYGSTPKPQDIDLFNCSERRVVVV